MKEKNNLLQAEVISFHLPQILKIVQELFKLLCSLKDSLLQVDIHEMIWAHDFGEECIWNAYPGIQDVEGTNIVVQDIQILYSFGDTRCFVQTLNTIFSNLVSSKITNDYDNKNISIWSAKQA